MTGPATPGQEGPSYAPPPLPEGWIAQWDGMSRKYYFVQLSTGASQWETPTHAAPTGPTPQATPQGIEHPYGTPSQQDGEVIDNQDGTRSVRYADGRVEPLPQDGERGLGTFAMNQLLGGGKKQNQGGLGQLGGLASQFLGGGSSHGSQGHSSGGSAASGIVGALAGQLLGGGKKQDNQPQSYTGSQNQQQSQGGGFMGSLGGMFGGHSGGGQGPQGGNFGYSQHNNQQGGYTGSAPPTSYQPSSSAHTSYNPPPPPQQHPYANQSSPPSYGSQEHSFGQSPSHQQPPYAAPSNQQPAYGTPSNQQQQPYGQPPSNQQQPPYGGTQQPPYGGIQHQPSYGSGHLPPQSQQYPPPPSNQPGQYAEMSGGLYGNNGAPQIPTGSHPGQQYNSPLPNQGYGAPGGYPRQGQPSQQGRW